MPVTVGPDVLKAVHKGSDQPIVAGATDVCKVPSQPPMFVPVPYPNTAPPLEPAIKSAASSKVLKKASSLPVSTGDEAGTSQGVIKRGELKRGLQVAGFSDAGVKLILEGSPVVSSADKMLLYSNLNRR
jgi:hypothetical protein